MNLRAQTQTSYAGSEESTASPHAAAGSLHHRSSGQDPVARAEVSRQLMELARRVARSDCTVLIVGESGTGKEVLARYIHRHSQRGQGPFVAINCAAIPDHLLEGMLFGWERGAFTGAQAAHAGKFEQAQHGTLLLDEVAEIPLSLQAKLLRVLQEREVERLGARTPINLDVRILATTNRRLRADVVAGRFREDLYYRLNVFPLTPLPLRRRRDDVLPLAMRSLTLHSRPGARIPALHPDAAQRLLTYAWPGNVRELENVMQRALVLCDGDVIHGEHIVFESAASETADADTHAAEPASCPVNGAANAAGKPRAAAAGAPIGAATAPGVAGASLDAAGSHSDARDPGEAGAAAGALADTLAQIEQKLILQALRAHGSRERVAAQLGISARTLRYKLARLRAAGIDLALIEGAS